MIQENTDKPLITVVGAASKQGRSVVHALLDSGRYRVRALTRRRDSEPAQVLAQRGAEVVVAPLQPGMQAELTAAMRGSAGAFLMTPPIVKVPPADDEFTLGQELANAAVAAGVEHVVFSGLENVEARTGGTKWAPHFTDKARVEAYIRSLPIRSSFVYLAFFYTNFLEYYVPQRGADGLTFAIYLPPHLPMPFVDPLTATGPAVREMFDHPTQYAGQSLPVIGEILSRARHGGHVCARHRAAGALRLRVHARRLVALLSGLRRQRALRARDGGHGGIRRRIWLLRPRARPDVESEHRSAGIDLGTVPETQQLARRAANLWRRP